MDSLRCTICGERYPSRYYFEWDGAEPLICQTCITRDGSLARPERPQATVAPQHTRGMDPLAAMAIVAAPAIVYALVWLFVPRNSRSGVIAVVSAGLTIFVNPVTVVIAMLASLFVLAHGFGRVRGRGPAYVVLYFTLLCVTWWPFIFVVVALWGLSQIGRV